MEYRQLDQDQQLAGAEKSHSAGTSMQRVCLGSPRFVAFLNDYM